MRLVLVLLIITVSVFASLPERQALRFKEVTGNNLGQNSVNLQAMQDFSVRTESVVNHAVTNSKVAPLTITADEVAPGSVTTSGLSVDRIVLTIRDNDVHAASQNPNVQLPVGVESIKPSQFVGTTYGSSDAADYPDTTFSYRVEGKARGPGIILGWYPSRNGHLLRYQTARALRGIVCADIDLGVLVIDQDGDDGDVQNYSIVLDNLWISDRSIDAVIPNGCNDFCSALDTNQCPGGVNGPGGDPFCANYPEDASVNSPDRCGRYTNAEDVRNPQEGTAIYSPSVERVTINDEGLVEMWFFGRGSVIPNVNQDIDITVIVLLNDQYGRNVEL